VFKQDVRTGWSVPQLAVMGFILGVTAAYVVQQGLPSVSAALGWGQPNAKAISITGGWAALLWGGVWGGLLIPSLIRAGDALLWPVAVAAGALVPTLAASLVDVALAGETGAAVDDNARVTTLLAINAAWALATAARFQLVRTVTSIVLLTRGMP
jgi:hypothetical protein